MKKTDFKKVLAFILCTVLIAATALFAAGCGDSSASDSGDTASSEGQTQAQADNQSDSPADAQEDVVTVGEGDTDFIFNVEGPEGESLSYDVYTDETTVGAALLDNGLIAGDEGEYGLYVKTVSDITLDYDSDGMYWAFYINDEYASAGVDQTDIQADQVYSFKAEK